MTPAPHDPIGHPEASGTRGSPAPLGGAYLHTRRGPPPITDTDYLAYGRNQYARGYNDGIWDILKLIGVVVALATVVLVVLLTR